MHHVEIRRRGAIVAIIALPTGKQARELKGKMDADNAAFPGSRNLEYRVAPCPMDSWDSMPFPNSSTFAAIAATLTTF